ncbi:orotidine-5'-phosphate decarboxylase [Pediococcus claussenii]|nr:orotidine-5'-phosphate decarboxylase [Pediococcus claussenii]ANZ70532.1 orotidine 5'-phosphate decarboxylase [Pediococcus claussenii]ANZ72346.1 orotidine 5'-phosphate decarboxylase [Pediococcus claussenii]
MQNFLNNFQVGKKPVVKIGMELFYQYGPALIKEVQRQGFKIFLDLKLNDIPNTVERGMFQIAKLGVQYTTVHALGGTEMMQAAIRGAQKGATSANVNRPLVLAVTELTSISEKVMHDEQNIDISMREQVESLINLSYKAGTDGVICSALDLKELDGNFKNFKFITPGIRPLGFEKSDQKRVVTPTEARQFGSTDIVVGRPITRSNNPLKTYQQIFKEWSK